MLRRPNRRRGVNQTIARNALFTLVAIWLGLVSSVAAAGDGDFEETHGFLQVVIGGKTVSAVPAAPFARDRERRCSEP